MNMKGAGEIGRSEVQTCCCSRGSLQPLSGFARSEKGAALILTLMFLAIITAVVVEFSYGVYTTTAGLYNWKDSQRLSFVSESGMSLAVKTLSDAQSFYPYTYPARIEIPVPGILEGFQGNVLISVEDENSKLNLNSLVWPNGRVNERAYDSLRKLLNYLELDETIADRIVDWTDRDGEPRLAGSEDSAKNSYMESTDELLLISDVDRETYAGLLPYITVYGLNRSDSDLVNINTAPLPVIISLNDDMTKELAERIIDFRDVSPLEKTSDIVKVAGFEGTLGQSLMGRIAVKGTNFRIRSSAEEKRLKRIIEAVVEFKGSSTSVIYWLEI
jgi:general secretion pathway protein K